MSEIETSPTATDLWRSAADAFAAWRSGAAPMDELVRLVGPVLWQVTRAAGLDRDEAEDVVQTTWLALVDNADRLEHPAAVGGWLCTTARRQAWRTARQAGRQLPTRDEVIAERLPRQAGPEQRVLLDEEGVVLRECLDRLTERCRTLLRILAAEPRPSYEAVSVELEMPVGSIGPTRGRCLAKLRHELSESGAL
ncbi:MAG TPA: sigma-70 family RNA polymerase sigma factor [Marmoricola sp.]|nr:sigma-70 family RNA polymerase sigma factor [Marmoricola sp.]